jgi:light-regulated signal transduction histidine kinase (bacteriophytochrome)
MRKTHVNLQEMVDGIINELKSETENRAILWKKGQLPEAKADFALLRQVFNNLLLNAIKYTRNRNPAEIEIGSLNDSEQEITIFVRDNGAGFDMRYADKLFGVFQRLHRVDEFEGTGIGLANVRRIISRHGGRTWGEGKVDAGATFYFTLPR